MEEAVDMKDRLVVVSMSCWGDWDCIDLGRGIGCRFVTGY